MPGEQSSNTSRSDERLTPGKVSARVQLMREAARLPYALMAGSRRMREQAEWWLPRLGSGAGRESLTQWRARVARSYCEDRYATTVREHVGRIHAAPVLLEGTSNELWNLVAEDIDALGSAVSLFGSRALRHAMLGGLAVVVVDRAPLPNDATEADRLAARPYAVLYTIWDVDGWELASPPGGGPRSLSRLLLRESPDIVLELLPGEWRRHQQQDGGLWLQVSRGDMGVEKIPAQAFYGHYEDEWSGSIYLPTLSDLNLAHYQATSEQRIMVSAVRIAILAMYGFAKDTDVSTLGQFRMIKSESADAKVEWVEHKGTAAKAGSDDLERLERAMSAAAYEAIRARGPAETATGRYVDAQVAASMLDEVALRYADSLVGVVRLFADWLGVPRSKAGRVVLQSRDLLTAADGAEVAVLRQMALDGQLTLPTLWRELQRRGVLGETFDAKLEAQALDAEAAGGKVGVTESGDATSAAGSADGDPETDEGSAEGGGVPGV